MNNKKCINCGEKMRKDYHLFCSLNCKNQHSFKEIQCEYCKKLFKKRGYEIKKTKHNFCSKICWARFFSKKASSSISEKRKGKTYEEIYGKEKANNLKKKLTKIHKGLQSNENHPLFLKNINTKEMVELYNKVKSSRLLAKRFNCSSNTIINRLKKLSINVHKKVKIRSETREKMAFAKLGKPNYSRLGKRHTKEVINKIKNARKLQILPKKDTLIEVKIQNFLKELNIEFFTHQYIYIKHGYQCDIFIPILNLVIECDGDYWHKYPTGKDIDYIRTSELIEKGFKVLRLWEYEIKKLNLQGFKEKLDGFSHSL